MNNIIENNGEVQFANGQINRDLRGNAENLLERTDSAMRWKPCEKIPTKYSSAGSNCLTGLGEGPALLVEVLRVEDDGTVA